MGEGFRTRPIVGANLVVVEIDGRALTTRILEPELNDAKAPTGSIPSERTGILRGSINPPFPGVVTGIPLDLNAVSFVEVEVGKSVGVRRAVMVEDHPQEQVV